MITVENFEKIKRAVHQPLNWDDYNSTSVMDNTNCFAHAIGSTVTADGCAYRLGILSGLKDVEEKYFSINEVNEIFEADLNSIDLEFQKIKVKDVSLFLKEEIQDFKLEDNQYIVALFVKVYGPEIIRDFHFLRFDKEIGWSEKRWRSNVYFIKNILMFWPCDWNDRLVGIYQITR